MTYVSSTIEPPSHALSRECQAFKLLQCTYVFASCGTMFHLSMSILFLCTYEFIESNRLTRCLGDSNPWSMSCLVALYRAMRLRFGYRFESCDANDPRNVKNTYLAKHRPIFLPPLLLVGSKELVLRVPKRGQFHAAIRVTRKRCDSCAQLALGTRTVSRRNF